MGRNMTCTPWEEHANAILCYATTLMLCYSSSRVLNIGLLEFT